MFLKKAYDNKDKKNPFLYCTNNYDYNVLQTSASEGNIDVFKILIEEGEMDF